MRRIGSYLCGRLSEGWRLQKRLPLGEAHALAPKRGGCPTLRVDLAQPSRIAPMRSPLAKQVP
jgi:hypothetical protein